MGLESKSNLPRYVAGMLVLESRRHRRQLISSAMKSRNLAKTSSPKNP